MDPAADTRTEPAPERGSRLATAAWIVSVLVLVALLALLFVRVRDTGVRVHIDSALAKGARPAAPQLPTDAAFDAPGLPAWLHDGAANPGHRIALVNFWASWCGPCRDEAPAFAQVARDYAHDGVDIVGVNAGAEDGRADARAFARSFHLRYPLVRATRAQVEAWGVHGYPETFLVDERGRIAAHVNGPVDEATMRDLLDRELARRSHT